MTDLEAYLKRTWPGEVIAFKDFGDTMYAAAVRMGFNHRIIYGSTDDPFGYDRYWCFDIGEAVIALAAWTDRDSEPSGWKKNYRGDYSPEFLDRIRRLAQGVKVELVRPDW